MPLPKRNSGESRDDFMERCMENPTMNSEFPDKGQRYAVCESRMKKYMYKKFSAKEEKIEQRGYLINKPIFENTEISIDEVPINENLKEVFKYLSEGDDKPFFFISGMALGEEHPADYGEIMTEEWAESFVDKLNIAPFPMSAYGHINTRNPMERVESQGYVVGGKVSDGVMYLKNYLLKGDTDKTKELATKTIREMKAKMLSTSISNFQKMALIEDDEGNTKWYVIESMYGQRNDIVEHDLTGSEASIVARSFKKAEDESANKNQGEESMTTQLVDKKEMLSKLRNLKQGGDLSVEEIADTFGLELATKEMKVSLTTLKSVKDFLGNPENILEALKVLKETADKADDAEFKVYKTEALKEVFKDNEAILENATELFSLKKGNKADCVKEAQRVANLKTIKDLASKMAGDMSKQISLKPKITKNESKQDVLEM